MREHGLVQSAANLGLTGHACWTYDDEAPALRRALDAAARPELPLDVSRLAFADHNALRTLADSGIPFRGIPASMRRVCELLELRR
jgi:hypothetical protein